MLDLINRGFWGTLDWIYPPVCASCGEPGARLCGECHSKIKFIKGKSCLTCGVSFRGMADDCSVCQTISRPYTAVRNLADYTGVIRECIHALKYENNQGLGVVFSDELAAVVVAAGWSPDLVVPVPLSRQRMAERGYNQAACLAKPLAARLDIRYHPYGLARTRDTASQVGLSGEDRRRNVTGAFQAIPEVVAGKKVLLVDDVMTTGSTLEACASALTESGAGAVYCLTLGRFAIKTGISQQTRLQV